MLYLGYVGSEVEPLPRMVRRMLSASDPLQPRSINTPIGGRITAKMSLQMSLAVKGMANGSARFGLGQMNC